MRNFLLVVILAVGVVAVSSLPRNTSSVAADAQHSTAVFDSDDKLKLPTGYRRWVFLIDTEQRPCYVPMPFVASHSMHLTTAEVQG